MQTAYSSILPPPSLIPQSLLLTLYLLCLSLGIVLLFTQSFCTLTVSHFTHCLSLYSLSLYSVFMSLSTHCLSHPLPHSHSTHCLSLCIVCLSNHSLYAVCLSCLSRSPLSLSTHCLCLSLHNVSLFTHCLSLNLLTSFLCILSFSLYLPSFSDSPAPGVYTAPVCPKAPPIAANAPRATPANTATAGKSLQPAGGASVGMASVS